MIEAVDHLFQKLPAPRQFADPERQLNNLCEQLWLIAAISSRVVLGGVVPAQIRPEQRHGLVSGISAWKLRTPDSVCCPSSAPWTYFRPGYSPEETGSITQAVAYPANSRAACATHPC